MSLACKLHSENFLPERNIKPLRKKEKGYHSDINMQSLMEIRLCDSQICRLLQMNNDTLALASIE